MSAPLNRARLGRVAAVLTDVDGTLTTKGRLRSQTIRALERLGERRIKIILVSGRPAGFAESWARTLPVDGVIAENGGVTFRWREGRLQKSFAEAESERGLNRRRLEREVRAVLKRVSGARLSTDSAFTEVDLAIDYNEEARLGDAAADAIEAALRERGVTAVRSSVHVNCWIGGFDKASASLSLLRQLRIAKARAVYVGDSFNDAPMFAAFPLSVGVANVRSVLSRIEHVPAFITRAAEGRGFEELTRAILAARSC